MAGRCAIAAFPGERVERVDVEVACLVSLGGDFILR